MIGEIIVGLMVVAIVGMLIYMVYLNSSTLAEPRVPLRKAPAMPPVKPTRPTKAQAFAAEYRSAPQDIAPLKKRPVASTSSARSSYPSGGSTTHIDTSASDTLSTLLILDALDDSSNYVEPSVDRYVEPSYSSPTPSSYSSSSSYDDSSSRSSSYSSSSWGGDSSSSSSSSYDSGSSSSSSSSSYD